MTQHAYQWSRSWMPNTRTVEAMREERRSRIAKLLRHGNSVDRIIERLREDGPPEGWGEHTWPPTKNTVVNDIDIIVARLIQTQVVSAREAQALDIDRLNQLMEVYSPLAADKDLEAAKFMKDLITLHAKWTHPEQIRVELSSDPERPIQVEHTVSVQVLDLSKLPIEALKAIRDYMDQNPQLPEPEQPVIDVTPTVLEKPQLVTTTQNDEQIDSIDYLEE